MNNISTSNAPNYQAILDHLTKLEKRFKKYLISQNASKKTQTNYVSDIRNFSNWFLTSLQVLSTTVPENEEQFLNSITPEHLENYKQSLLLEHVSIATINRRLSSLRIFLRFCIAEGLITVNAIEHVANIRKTKSMFGLSEGEISAIFEDYSNSLKEKNYDPRQTHEYIAEARDFLFWLDKQKKATSQIS